MIPPAGERRTYLERFGLLAIVAVGIAFRVSHAFRGALWRDEAQFINIVALPTTSDVIRFLGAHESHPPLYYLLMRVWTAVFGTSDTALLMPGIILGALIIFTVWVTGRVIGNAAAGWVAAAFVAISPAVIESDSTARPYTFLALAIILAVWFLHRALETGHRRWLAGWVFSAAVILYTHNWGLLPVAAMSAGALWAILRRRATLRLGSFLAAGAALMMVWLPWLPSFLSQARHAGQLQTSRSPLFRGSLHLLASVPGTTVKIGSVLAFGLIAMLLLRRENLLTARHARAWVSLSVWLILGSMVLATVGSVRSNLLIRHTIVMLAPLALVTVAVVLTQPVPVGRALSVVTLVATLTLNLREAVRVATTPRSNVDVLARLAADAGPKDLILLVPGDLVSSFERYYAGAALTFPFPDGSGSRPIEFNDRVVRDTRPEVAASLSARVIGVLQGGGQVWAVTAGIPLHLTGLWQDLKDRMHAVGGVPGEPAGADVVEATRESATLRVWAIPASTPGR